MKFIKPSTAGTDIVIWDGMGEELLRPALKGFSVYTVYTRKEIYICVSQLINAARLLVGSISDIIVFYRLMCPSLNRLERVAYGIRRIASLFKLILHVSVIFGLQPKLVITHIDNSITFQTLDFLLHKYYNFIAVQNANRFHDPDLYKTKLFRHFYVPKSFHSCFCYLSAIDLDSYLAAGWKIDKHFHVGSLRASETIRRFGGYSRVTAVQPGLDILIVANSSNSRLSQKKVAELVHGFVTRFPRYKVAIAAKRSKADLEYPRHVNDLKLLYGEGVTILENIEHASLTNAVSAKVVIGSYTTLLREALSFGVKVYPINFDHPSVNYYFRSLTINPAPSPAEFNMVLNELLAGGEVATRLSSTEFKAYVGCVPGQPDPSERLRKVVISILHG